MAAEGDEDVTAAELALGLLDGDERAAALRRVLADPAFAREVETWRAHFGALFGQWPEERAPEGVLERLERSIELPRPSSRLWPTAAAVLALVAASLLLVVVLRPPAGPPSTPQGGPMVASLDPVERGPASPAVYEPSRGELRLPRTAAAPAGHSAELWVIGGDRVPRSLGVLKAGQRTVIQVAPALRNKFAPGAKLAITAEPTGGSPTGLPTGPVIASGELFSS